MGKFKRDNTRKGIDILVATGDQSLATGTLVNATSALGIASGQLGVLSEDFSGTAPKGTFITAGHTVTNVDAIRVLQGTPKSSNITTVDVWEVSDKGYMSSDIIYRDNIVSVSSIKCRIGAYSSAVCSAFTAPVANTEYLTFVYLDSIRDDRDYSDNDNVFHALVQTPTSLAGISDTTELVIGGTAIDINKRSRMVGVSNQSSVKGNKNVVAFGINTAGSFGQALGTITNATSFTFMSDNGTSSVFTSSNEFVRTVGEWINGSALTGSSTIEVLDPDEIGKGVQAQATVTITDYTQLGTDVITVNGTALTEGTDWNAATSNDVTATNLAAAIDALSGYSASASGAVVTIITDTYGVAGNTETLAYTDGGSAGATISGGTFAGGAATNIDVIVVMGLDAVKAVYADNIEQVRTSVKVNFGDAFRATTAPTVVNTQADEGTGSGVVWDIVNDDRHQLTIHTMQNQPFYEVFSEGVNYINQTKSYSASIIEYYDYEETLTLTHATSKQLVILLPCEVSSAFGGTAADAATNIGAGNAAITTLTSNDAGTGTASANTLSELNASLGVWLESARTYTGHKLLAESTAANNFA